MTRPSIKRAAIALTVVLALTATALAGAAGTAGAPDARPLEGLRPLERLAAALPAGREELAAQAAKAPLGGVAPRTVGEAIAGDRPRARGLGAVFPVKGPSGFGEAAARFGAARTGHVHAGQDVFAPAGTPLVAVRDGVVVETGDDGGRGNYVALYSPEARQTYVYLHMDEPSRVAPRRRVRAGQRLGGVGCTGSCFGDHLHFEVRRGRGTQAPAMDPLPLLKRWRRAR
jgi:murein DD-endopeptidase MepM/ murein hydrolase activator NlpD